MASVGSQATGPRARRWRPPGRRYARMCRRRDGEPALPWPTCGAVCSRSRACRSSVWSQSRGSQTGCSPIGRATRASEVARTNRSSLPKKQQRRPACWAAFMNALASPGKFSSAAMGGPAATHADPVSTYATQPSSRNRYWYPSPRVWNAVAFQPCRKTSSSTLRRPSSMHADAMSMLLKHATRSRPAQAKAPLGVTSRCPRERTRPHVLRLRVRWESAGTSPRLAGRRHSSPSSRWERSPSPRR